MIEVRTFGYGEWAHRDDYTACLEIRRRVFVEEQRVPAELEVDEHEAAAQFFLALEDGEPLGTGRFRVKGEHVKFERIATLAASRGRGIGSALMRAMQDEARRRHGALLPMMHAQLDAVPFYERLGWQADGPVFHEAGIAHLKMTRPHG
jgi:ElaA protein